MSFLLHVGLGAVIGTIIGFVVWPVIWTIQVLNHRHHRTGVYRR